MSICISQSLYSEKKEKSFRREIVRRNKNIIQILKPKEYYNLISFSKKNVRFRNRLFL